MESATITNLSVLSEEQIDSINIRSILPEVNPPREERLNFIATFIAENGAELKFEFHCSNSEEALYHVEGLVYYLKEDIYFLSISGDKWNVTPDRLKRIHIKRKIELEFMELEFIDSSFFSVRNNHLKAKSASKKLSTNKRFLQTNGNQNIN